MVCIACKVFVVLSEIVPWEHKKECKLTWELGILIENVFLKNKTQVSPYRSLKRYNGQLVCHISCVSISIHSSSSSGSMKR